METVKIDLTGCDGLRKGMMLAVTTEDGVGGMKENKMIYVASVKLSDPWPPGEESHSYDGCLYKRVIAVTSDGVSFVWKDETVEGAKVVYPARQYGSALNPPKHWGQKQWEKTFGPRY